MRSKDNPNGRWINGVWVHGAGRHGIHVKSGGISISNSVVSNCGGDGIKIGGSDDDDDVDDLSPRLPRAN